MVLKTKEMVYAALFAALIAVAIVGLVKAVGTDLGAVFTKISTNLK